MIEHPQKAERESLLQRVIDEKERVFLELVELHERNIDKTINAKLDNDNESPGEIEYRLSMSPEHQRAAVELAKRYRFSGWFVEVAHVFRVGEDKDLAKDGYLRLVIW